MGHVLPGVRCLSDPAGRLEKMVTEIGDPIPEVFPPHEATARFVVAMAMARNDIERALRDVEDAITEGRPDFSYRARLSIGHLVEALEALNAYSQTYDDVRALISRVPVPAQEHLRIARGSLQKAGQDVLRRARDSTFHYPSPRSNYSPTSDSRLADALAGMQERGVEIHLDGDTMRFTLTFADDIALALALGSTVPTELQQSAQTAAEGAAHFVVWVSALVKAYQEANGLAIGEPDLRPKPTG